MVSRTASAGIHRSRNEREGAMTKFVQKYIRGRKQEMFSRIRRGLTYANMWMTVCLVFAMSGGAGAPQNENAQSRL
jgi:hypothetical protein